MGYDSRKDTIEHIMRVQALMNQLIFDLTKRAGTHDNSKLQEPEKSLFDEWTPKLKELAYGTPEYKEALKNMGPALGHHYSVNSHHPEHYVSGVNDMTLMDIIEMFCDWKAASERHLGGNFLGSLDINRQRFGIDIQLFKIMENTARLLNW